MFTSLVDLSLLKAQKDDHKSNVAPVIAAAGGGEGKMVQAGTSKSSGEGHHNQHDQQQVGTSPLSGLQSLTAYHIAFPSAQSPPQQVDHGSGSIVGETVHLMGNAFAINIDPHKPLINHGGTSPPLGGSPQQTNDTISSPTTFGQRVHVYGHTNQIAFVVNKNNSDNLTSPGSSSPTASGVVGFHQPPLPTSSSHHSNI
jgi:hypothetical protein